MTLTHKQVVNIYITYGVNWWSNIQVADFALGDFLFRAVKLTKNNNPVKHKYSCCGTGFHVRGSFSSSDSGGFGKNVVMFGTDNNVLDGLDDTMLTVEKESVLPSNRRNFI